LLEELGVNLIGAASVIDVEKTLKKEDNGKK
jgi:hypothetical protein